MDHLKSTYKVPQDELKKKQDNAIRKIAEEICKRLDKKGVILPYQITDKVLSEFINILTEKGTAWLDGEWHYWDKRETCTTGKCIFLQMCLTVEARAGLILYINLDKE